MVCDTKGRGSGRHSLWGVAKMGLAEERWCTVEGRGERGGVEMGNGSCRESFGGRKGNLSVHHGLRAYVITIKSLPLDDAVCDVPYLKHCIIKHVLHIIRFCNGK